MRGEGPLLAYRELGDKQAWLCLESMAQSREVGENRDHWRWQDLIQTNCGQVPGAPIPSVPHNSENWPEPLQGRLRGLRIEHWPWRQTRPRFKSRFGHLLAGWPWAGPCSLCLSPSAIREAVTVPTLQAAVGRKWNSTCKLINRLPGNCDTLVRVLTVAVSYGPLDHHLPSQFPYFDE